MILILFLLGLAIGSFLNVVIDRIPRNKSIFFGRSYCDYCRHSLSYLDLIPILSFVFLRGKCRYCHKKISFQNPIVELTTGILFSGLFILLNYGLISNLQNFIFDIFVGCICVVIFAIDFKKGIIPNTILIFASVVSLIYISSISIMGLYIYVLSGVGAFLFFFAFVFFTKGKGMGLGDAKLAFLIGLTLGWEKTALAFYITFLTGGVVSLILIMSGRKKLKGGTIPLGPFLAMSFFLCLIFGNNLVSIASKYILGI